MASGPQLNELASSATMANVFVLGAGGHAKVVVSTLSALGVRVAGIYDDDQRRKGTKTLQAAVLGEIRELYNPKNASLVVGVGDNGMRRHLAVRFPSANWITIIHPHAHVQENALLGPGTVVLAGAVIETGARIGRHCIINTGATISRDCVVGDFCHVAPGCCLSQNVTLGDGVFMGISSVAATRTSIGAWTIVGAGAAVVTDLPDRVVALGVPATGRRN